MTSLRNLLLTLGILLSSMLANAAFIRNYPVTLTQPDGAVFNCFLTGDEYYNWVHDEDNYTITRNDQGYYCYAQLYSGELIATEFVVGKNDPAKAGLTPGINISTAKMLQKRNEFIENTPKKLKQGNISKATGTINNIVIFIRFAGEAEFGDSLALYDDLFNNVPGTNSMKNYFDEVSYGALEINSTFYPTPGTFVVSYQDVLTREYYEPYDPVFNPNGYTDRTATEHELLKNAVNSVSAQIPGGLDLDYNSDGYVDNICFIVSGSPTAWSTLLWPHRWSLYSESVYINGLQVWDYNFQLQDNLASSGNGVLCHEMFHTLGAPDLYHYNHDDIDPVGSWDLMEFDMDPPQHMGAFMKYSYGGWIGSIPTISAPNTYTLNPITSSTNNCYRINSPYSASEYFVVEYRRKTGVFESSIPASGLIVYRINTDFDGMGNAAYDGVSVFDEVYIYRPYGTIVLNGIVDNANFSANVNRKKINDYTNPSSFLYDGSDGGLNVSNITSALATISFDLNGGPSYPVNAGLDYVTEPVSDCGLSGVEPVTVNIHNYGSSSISAGLQMTYVFDGGAPVSEMYSGPAIASGSTQLFTFSQTVDLSAAGNHTLLIYCSIASDGNKLNDTLYEVVTNGNLNYYAPNADILSGTYTDLGSNGSAISVANYDNANSAPVDIGFTFYYNCQDFTQFVLNTNGFIKLGNSNPSTPSLFFSSATNSTGGVFNSTNSADVNIISAFNHDLESGTGTPEFRVYTSGTAPNRVCTIQFEDMRDKTTSPAIQFNNIDFQIKLYETTNVIDIVYGTWEASANPSAFKTSGVGLKGPGNDYAQVLVVRKSSSTSWSSATFDNATYSSTSAQNFGNPPTRPIPVSGLIYRFLPADFPLAVTGSASSVTSSDATLNGEVNAKGLNTSISFEYGLTPSYGSSVAAIPASLSDSVLTPVYADITGLLPATQYHYRVVASSVMGTSYGADSTFNTTGTPPVPPQGNETVIGETTYDLQTNGSVDNRIVVHNDGTISATWTYSSSMLSSFDDRGTGYNYFDGSSWGSIPSSRLESVRTGWPALGTSSSDNDIIFAHNSSDSLLETSGPKGGGSFSTIYNPVATGNILWPRIGISGSKVHLIALYNEQHQGLDGALVYFRSQNEGASWDISEYIIPGLDSSCYIGFNGDNYAVDVKGDTVAIVEGDLFQDIVLVKSTDGGDSWNKTIISQFPLPKYDYLESGSISDTNSDFVADEIYTCDGNLDVIIDNNGTAHVFYGRQMILDDDPTPGANYTYFPATDSLFYWNENLGAGNAKLIAGVCDEDSNGTADIIAMPGVYYNGMSSMPSAAVDADNHIYVTYSSVVENTDDGNGYAFRNVYYIKSADGGNTWMWPPVNLTPYTDKECVFASLNRVADTSLHFIYQKDTEAGMAARGVYHDIHTNEIIYKSYYLLDGEVDAIDSLCYTYSIDLLASGNTGDIVKWQKRLNGGAWTDILTDTAVLNDTPGTMGVWEYRVVTSMRNTEFFSDVKSVYVDVCSGIDSESINCVIYPNPAGDFINIKINDNRGEDMVFDILDRTGRILSSGIGKYSVGGYYTTDISGLASGIYFIKIVGKNVSFVGKFVKE